MKQQSILLTAIIGAVGSLPAFAGVRTLTSDEMVETYVKDSAVIVVPRQQQRAEEDRRRILRSLTISPGEPVQMESEAEAERAEFQFREDEERFASLKEAEEEFIRRTLLTPTSEIAAIQPPDYQILNIPPIIFGEQLVIPEGPFAQTFLNDQLGIAFDGSNLNLSIGNPPGIDQITLPQGIDEGPITLVPRPGGGFDLSIQVPEQ
ncbi:hypothetical protein [Marinobacter zhejiangensis]|uniref:Type IV pilus biogenesis protein PilP n=1 Tax=Marinobacter zhejiangensis TaxID=488535 RepID=A0A1I4RSW1_9GAMM|nr:hypothetical protein [Marinobacter zhejiangensis]SFM55073.1 hypothetical protein SAMN04487963_2918 [Marinobacter zhejiangensis]